MEKRIDEGKCSKSACVIDWLQSILLFALRLAFGIAFLETGFGKFSHITNVISLFTGLGIPFPELTAYVVASIECVGGGLLIIGLGTRLASLLLIMIMVGAFLTAHIDSVVHLFDNPSNFVRQPPFSYLLATLFIAVFGPGKISLDYILGKWMNCSSKNS